MKWFKRLRNREPDREIRPLVGFGSKLSDGFGRIRSWWPW